MSDTPRPLRKGPGKQPGLKMRVEEETDVALLRFQQRFVNRLGHLRQKCPNFGVEALSRASSFADPPRLELVWAHDRADIRVHDCIDEVEFWTKATHR